MEALRGKDNRCPLVSRSRVNCTQVWFLPFVGDSNTPSWLALGEFRCWKGLGTWSHQRTHARGRCQIGCGPTQQKCRHLQNKITNLTCFRAISLRLLLQLEPGGFISSVLSCAIRYDLNCYEKKGWHFKIKILWSYFSCNGLWATPAISVMQMPKVCTLLYIAFLLPRCK